MAAREARMMFRKPRIESPVRWRLKINQWVYRVRALGHRNWSEAAWSPAAAELDCQVATPLAMEWALAWLSGRQRSLTTLGPVQKDYQLPRTAASRNRAPSPMTVGPSMLQ